MEYLALFSQRNVFIALAVSGALVATAGGILLRKGSVVEPRVARFVLRLGYGISWGSVALFIAAGLLGR